MKALLLSDIHSNITALEAVILDARAHFDYDETWVLGDTVGYGPDPAKCLALLSSIRATVVGGNHDLAVAGSLSTQNFNPIAAVAVSWTQLELNEPYIQQLKSLPTRLERHGITLVHGSPRNPVWEYVISEHAAQIALSDIKTEGLAVGHTHIPAIFELRSEEINFIRPGYDQPHSFAGSRFIVNPGGVGQPRDGDPRASYALLDLDNQTITHRRTEYDAEATATRILQAGLPAFLADRLKAGI